MRECEGCLHYRDNYCLVHQSEKYKGCESYWPKDGAKCRECRFWWTYGNADAGLCFHSSHDRPTVGGKEFCANWRAKE